jgi:hypothetical protein
VLTPLAPDMWIADMPASKMGFEFGARMTVIRLPSGGLFVHSPIHLTPHLRTELDALGPIAAVVAPARFHVEHVPEFAVAYPDARVYGVPALTASLKRWNYGGALAEAAPELWDRALEQSPFRGSRLYDEVDFYHPPSRTLILTDLCFNIPEQSSPTTRFFARALGVLGRPSASRSFGLTVRNRGEVRASLERIAAWDFDRMLLSHGRIVETGGKAAFLSAFRRFL